MPEGPDLAGPWGRELAAQVAAVGLEALPQMAEIWPLGGAWLCDCIHRKRWRGLCSLLNSLAADLRRRGG